MTRKALISTIVVIAPMLASASVASAQAAFSVYSFNSRPPAIWQEQDPAVSLYRSGRTQLNDSDFRKAAETFRSIYTRYPASSYAPDAYYWQAFALNRLERYEEARDVLNEQKRKHPRAATARDGAALLRTVEGKLASRGDAGAAQGIAERAPRATQGCGDVDEKVAVMNSFLNMDSERAIPLLKQILGRRDACSVELRRKAVFLVSQKRGAEVEDILLGSARNDPDKEVKSQAVFWLSQVPSERALGYLEDILKTSTDDEVRDKAVFAVSQHRGARAAEILRDYAQNTNAPLEVRDKAIFWIGQRRGSESATFLKQLYAKETNAKLKDKIIFSLSQQSGNQQWLMDLATDNSETIEMRKKALFWAGQSKETSLVELNGLYEKMGNREMKDQLIFVYSQRRETQAVDKLMQIARNEQDKELRKKAIFWLGQSKDPRAADFLMQMIND